MKLIVGLGNPELRYDGTRHNVGFATLDAYAEKAAVTWQEKPKFKAIVAELAGDEKTLLVKPTTYYNQVGESVRALVDFYKVTPEDVLIVHDELALPFGAVRAREQGSDAGNNGIKSVIQHVGPSTKRLRVGIAGDLSPSIDRADFVLGKFTASESEQLPEITEKAHKFIDEFIASQFEAKTL